ncbi:MAG TPA: BrnT family toxin [Cyanothece sp. UBA12306]|nr:BrnT family toxin [Cyanothece sp. UBA12306]
MEIEWDKNKAASNFSKHNIDFEDVKNIFLAPNRLEREDKRNYGETRIQVIGIVNQLVLFVVYTKRENRYRIISARRANKNERKQYYQG